jgi:hypothetical protein
MCWGHHPPRHREEALIVASGGVAGSFGLAWILISRLPG